jgi:hypothetical protein
LKVGGSLRMVTVREPPRAGPVVDFGGGGADVIDGCGGVSFGTDDLHGSVQNPGFGVVSRLGFGHVSTLLDEHTNQSVWCQALIETAIEA